MKTAPITVATSAPRPADSTLAVKLAVLTPHAPILVPPVGGERRHKADATIRALRDVAARVVAAAPQAVVLVSPHSPRHATAFGIWRTARLAGTFEPFAAPETGVDLPNDRELADAIVAQARAGGVETWDIPRGELDHGALVPLWFLADAGWTGPTVVLSLNHPGAGGLEELGGAIAGAAAELGRRIVFVASGDMSHRLKPSAPAGHHPRAKEFDRAFITTLERGAYRDLFDLDAELQELAAEDVVDSTVIAAAAVGWDSAGHEVLSYEGPFGVGYGVAVLFDESAGSTASATTATPQSLADLPRVARASLAAALAGAPDQPPAATTAELQPAHGVFVTLRHSDGNLRGCVGTLLPKFGSVVEETWRLAREAAFHDTRFAPVRAAELAGLRFEVSVLQPPELVLTETELDPQRYGLVVTADDDRRGALLPGISEIRTVARQLEIARRKGGIQPGERVRLQRFTVEKFSDADFIEKEN